MTRGILPAALIALGATQAVAQAPPNPSFHLVNRGQDAINEVYATPKGRPNWGRDRLGEYLLPPGQSFPVHLPADGSCAYDIRVVYASGKAEERRDFNTCEVETVVFPRNAGASRAARNAPASDPSFRLVNRGRTEVRSLFATPTGVEDWGRDHLRNDTVAPGASRTVRLPAGACSYDLRIVYANRDATERRDLNLCGLGDLPVP